VTGSSSGRIPRRILYVFNNAAFFGSHRLDVARWFAAQGTEVHLAAPAPFPVAVARVAQCHDWALERGRLSPPSAFRALRGLCGILARVRPDLVEFATIQPALLGGLVTLHRPDLGRVYWITGLGFAFSGRGPRAGAFRAVARVGYRLALRGERTRAIFENSGDRDRFVQAGLIPAERSVVIPGAGVDLERFHPSPEPPGEPVVVLAARMLRSKGVEDLIAAAAILRRRGLAVRCLLVGAPDPGNPESLSGSAIRAVAAPAGVEWMGHRDDMPAILSGSHIVCLPSWSEGAPKVLLEAAAAGRPAIGSDVPGIRAVIRPEETGILVPLRDPDALADAIARLAGDPALRRRMGRAARTLAESEFGVAVIAPRVARVYAAALGPSG
jgi:glycosyltransferase involved in cell wall biosynthesis